MIMSLYARDQASSVCMVQKTLDKGILFFIRHEQRVLGSIPTPLLPHDNVEDAVPTYIVSFITSFFSFIGSNPTFETWAWRVRRLGEWCSALQSSAPNRVPLMIKYDAWPVLLFRENESHLGTVWKWNQNFSSLPRDFACAARCCMLDELGINLWRGLSQGACRKPCVPSPNRL